jgi:hypothetical protein
MKFLNYFVVFLFLAFLLPFSSISQISKEYHLEVFEHADSKLSFRGISALSNQSAWFASDQGQVWYYSMDRGWEDRSPVGYNTSMWRDIEAFSEDEALVLSAGSPGLVLRTVDRGLSWQEVYRDDSPSIFFDAMDFWDAKRGIAFSDAQGANIGLISTSDSGKSWQVMDRNTMDTVTHKNQGGFAASGTCIRTFGKLDFAIILGGADANIFVWKEGQSFSSAIPMDHGEATKGPFSLSFKGRDTILVAGGDYRADSLSNKNLSISYDGGKSWQRPEFPSSVFGRYWSCVNWDGERIILCSRFGTALSFNNGASWFFENQGFYSNDGHWFSGPSGKIGRLTLNSK